MPRIEVNLSVFGADRRAAEENRALLADRGWAAINMMGAPGSGKTTLLQASLPRLRRPCAVLAGDVEGCFDAERLAGAGIIVAQINTHGACHLTAKLVREELMKLSLPAGALVVIENVGNLVCPALFDLGESGTVAVLSAAEGHEKPWKYPALFKRSDVTVISKVDLAAVARFDIAEATAAVLAQNPEARVLPLSAVTGEGMEGFIAYLEAWK